MSSTWRNVILFINKACLSRSSASRKPNILVLHGSLVEGISNMESASSWAKWITARMKTIQGEGYIISWVGTTRLSTIMTKFILPILYRTLTAWSQIYPNKFKMLKIRFWTNSSVNKARQSIMIQLSTQTHSKLSRQPIWPRLWEDLTYRCLR